MLEQILAAYPDEEFLKADGFDKAIIGVDGKSMRLIYSVEKCFAILAGEMSLTKQDLSAEERESGMTLKDKAMEMAIESFDYNTRGSYVGEKTPIWCEDNF